MNCRACGHTGLQPVLDLGSMPLVNSLLPPDGAVDDEPRYPLELVFCPSCTLTQITETVPPKKLFSDYTYFSSYSETMLAHARELADDLIRTRHLDGRSLVMEAASNDGYLLQNFVKKNIPVLGIEPAANVAKVAVEERKVPTLCAFFGRELADRLNRENRQADVLIGLNVLAHVPDLHGFLDGVRLVLKSGGTAVFEVPYVADLLDKCEFDTIYHEHLCYFSLTALVRLFQQHGLSVIDVARLPVHGGSIRIFASASGGPDRVGTAVKDMIEEESAKAGLPALTAFAARVRSMKGEIATNLAKIRAAGKTIAAYGAAAKGCVLLNYCGIGPDIVEYVVDRNPVKQGKRMPGTHQPIFPPSILAERRPDYLLILPWNIADEIVRQETAYRSGGGTFIVPVPEMRYV